MKQYKLNSELVELDSVTEVTNNLQNTVEEIQIEVDREKAAEKGLGALSNCTNS